MGEKTCIDNRGGATRQSNIELLRVLAIIGVIILHYNGYYAFDVVDRTSANWWILCSLESVFACAVNVFILISGFFLCTTEKRNFWKPIELVVQVSLFSGIYYLLRTTIGSDSFHFRSLIGAMIPNNYFVSLYIALYLISPYINVIFDRLTQAQMRRMVLILFLVFAVYPTLVDILQCITGGQWGGLSTVSGSGSLAGYSIVNFTLMYVIGAYLRRGACRLNQWRVSRLVLLWLICVIGQIAWDNSILSPCAWFYCNPLVIITAVVTFLLFVRFKIGYSRIINVLAEGAFSGFLLHFYFLPHIQIDRFATGNHFILLVHVLLSSFGIYGICWCIYWVYAKVSRPVFRRLSTWLDFNMDYLK